MIRVLMFPLLSSFDTAHESGIRRVVEAWHKYSKDYGVEYIECAPDETDNYDLVAIHAGSSNRYVPNRPMVAHLHGLYWSADYPCDGWEWRANRDVVDSIRHAYQVTVPSNWVAETLQRDMHLDPVVVPHGIEWDEWQDKDCVSEGYVLWNKNRAADVCDPRPVAELARRFAAMTFVATLIGQGQPQPNNVFLTGILPHSQMKKIVQHAGIYLSSTKETFGIGSLEAMASGVPVLGFAHGGNLELVQHGVNGYLARPGDYDDLAQGLEYCMKHRSILSENGRQIAKTFTWATAMERVARTYQRAMIEFEAEHRPMNREYE